MDISIEWAGDFVDLKEIKEGEIANRFTLSSAEVEEAKVVGDHLEKIVVAEVTQIETHPEADKLNLVTFQCGRDQSKQVVCGASNVKLGMKTPFAAIGVTLPIGFTLEPKKIRGILSEGMLCSEEELGLAEKSAGIMELPSDSQVGMTLAELWSEKKDLILDVDNKSLTHRPDMWGHYGVARELAAIFNRPLKRPYDSSWMKKYQSLQNDDPKAVSFEMDSDSAGLLYLGITLKGVSVAPSPRWMQNRLIRAGLRPINNIVDISNYVMLELGHPLHIFDRQKIAGDKLSIFRLKEDQNFVTLDEQERQLKAGDTVISDEKGPLVLAGIMGGLSSGVSEQTSEVFIEVANWKASEVRKTSTRLGLRTDSSQRFEKTLDSNQCEQTLWRTVELILELCPEAKVVGQMQATGVDLSKKEAAPLVIDTSFDKISKVLGIDLEPKRVVEIFEALDFKTHSQGDLLKVEVPSFRATKDIEFEEDLIEEIGRMIGYDNIAALSPKLDVAPVKLSSAGALHRKIRDFLVFQGRSFEVMTYPMIGEKLLERAKMATTETLVLKNALSKEASLMRPSLIPSFLEVASKNVKNFDHFRFFELGRSYHKGQKEFAKEKSILGICFYHQKENPFMELVNTTERMISALNLPATLNYKNEKFPSEVIPASWPGEHPIEYYDIRLMGKMKGSILSVHPLVLREFKIKGHLAIALIDLSDVENRELKDKVKYQALSKFPSSSFDWTVVVDSEQAIEDILITARKEKIKEMTDVFLVDVFQLNEKQKTVTLRATFQDPTKTLEGEFLTQARDKLVRRLDQAGFPLKVT